MTEKAESFYFKDLIKFKVPTEEEQKKYVSAFQRKDPDAVKWLIQSNLRFVVSVARRYQGRGLTYLELINEGNIGLLKAAKRYNSNLNIKFISYAVWWIRQSIQKALVEQASTIKIPVNKITLINHFKRELERNHGDFNKAIMGDEFRDYEKEIVEIMENMRGLSLNAPAGSSSGDGENTKTLEDILGKESEQGEVDETRELTAAIDSAMQNITLREERILRMFFGINFARQFTLEEIGKELNISRERVRMIRDQSLRKLFRNPTSHARLYPFINGLNKTVE